MLIEVNRRTESATGTTGEMLINGTHECWTIEREPGDHGHGHSIPPGTYRVVINWSPKFKREMPRLLDVPGRDGILIHRANHPAELEGCIAVGDKLDGESIVGGTSTPAFARVLERLSAARWAADPVICIVRPPTSTNPQP